MASKQKVHDIIHEASLAAVSDSADLAAAQTAMVRSIATEYGVEITDAVAADLLLELTEKVKSRPMLSNRQLLVGWIPGIDEEDNGSDAAALTEAIGWAAHTHFEHAEAK